MTPDWIIYGAHILFFGGVFGGVVLIRLIQNSKRRHERGWLEQEARLKRGERMHVTYWPEDRS